MPYCPNCGQKVSEDDQFCFHCGTPLKAREDTKSHNSDSSKYESKVKIAGRVLKCPYCGAFLKETDTVCPECGNELLEKDAVKSVRDFSMEIKALEAQRTKQGNMSQRKYITSGNPFKVYGEMMEMSMDYSQSMLRNNNSSVGAQEIMLIKTFPIPNTISEIIEFMILADANIDVTLSKNSLVNRTNKGYRENANISDAWVAKMQQAYHKAELLMSDDPRFEKIKAIYQAKMKALKMED